MPQAVYDERGLRSPRGWWRHVLVTLAGLVVAALAVAALRRLAHEVTLPQVEVAIRAVRPVALSWAALATVASYLILTGYDWLALGHLGYRLPLSAVATASFTSFTISHALGLTALTGGSVRYRLYTRVGVRKHDIVVIVALCGWTFWLGIVLAVGAGLLLQPTLHVAYLPTRFDGAVGLLLLAGAAAYLILAGVCRRELRVFGLKMTLPGVGRTLAQVAVGVADLTAAAAALYILLPATNLPPFTIVVTVYAVAMIVGALSHAPGGLGIFEAVVVMMLPRSDPGGVLAALLLFRLFYTVVPFALGTALLASTELVEIRHRRPADRPAAARQ